MEGVGSKQHQLSPRKLRGNEGAKKKQDAPYLEVRDPPDKPPGVSTRKGGFGGDFKRSGG